MLNIRRLKPVGYSGLKAAVLAEALLLWRTVSQLKELLKVAAEGLSIITCFLSLSIYVFIVPFGLSQLCKNFVLFI